VVSGSAKRVRNKNRECAMQYDPKKTLDEFDSLMQDIAKTIPEQYKAFISEKQVVTKADKVDEKTPESTKTLLWNNKQVKARKLWNNYIWSVENDTEYAVYVEYWVWWKDFNYNKPKWSNFYSWVGARMFTRTQDEEENEVSNIINKEIEKWI